MMHFVKMMLQFNDCCKFSLITFVNNGNRYGKEF